MAIQFGGNAVNSISFNGSDVFAVVFNGNMIYSKNITSNVLTVTSTYVVSNILYPVPQELPDYWQEPIMTVLDLKNQLDPPNGTLHVYDQNNNEKSDNDPACTKDTIVCSIDGTTIDTKMFIQKGDLDCNGIVDYDDMRIIVAHDTTEGPHITDPDILYAADINDDGTIDYKDRSYVIGYCNRTITNGLSSNSAWMKIQGSTIIYNPIHGDTLPTSVNPPVLVSELKNQLAQQNSLLHVYAYNGSELLDSDPVGSKMTVKYISDNGNVLDSKQFVLKGDVNGDGVINLIDRNTINDYISDENTIPYTDFEKRSAADVNEDNHVNATDEQLVYDFYTNATSRN